MLNEDPFLMTPFPSITIKGCTKQTKISFGLNQGLNNSL